MTRTTGYDCTPDPDLLRALRSLSFSGGIAGALSELVDNAFGQGRGNASQCTITYDQKAKTLTVLDNGNGMQAVGLLFKLGIGINRLNGPFKGDIGEFGSGGTMALLYLGDVVDVWTLQGGLAQKAHVNWVKLIEAGQFPVVPDTWAAPTAMNTPTRLLDIGHGTMIKIRLAAGRRISVESTQNKLAMDYAPGIRLGRELRWATIDRKGDVNERALTELLPEFSEGESITFDIPFEGDNGADLSVRGEVGRVPNLPASRSRVSIGFGPRVLTTTRDCYTLDGDSYAGVGVTGWLDLSDGWRTLLATTKDRVANEWLWSLLMADVFRAIRPILEAADEDKFDIVLEGLAMAMQVAFQGRAKVMAPVKGTGTSGGRRGRGDGKPKPGTGPNPGPTPDPDKPGDTPTDEEGEGAEAERESGTTTIRITPVNDEECEGLMAKAFIDANAIDVWVNKQHEDVQAILSARPTNAMAFNLLICTQLATTIASDDNLVAEVWGPGMLDTLDGLTDYRDRPFYLQKVLMGLVRDGERKAAA